MFKVRCKEDISEVFANSMKMLQMKLLRRVHELRDQ